MVSWLSSKPALHLLRVMAHVGLVARGLGSLRESSQVDVIVEAYVKALTEGQYQSAVALYAAHLPATSQISSYAHLLAGVKEEEEQRQCLELGREAGLDIGMVTKTVVETIRTAGQLEDTDKQSTELDQEVQLTELDLEKIRAINWLVFESAQRHEAIKQGNALIRLFLSMYCIVL
jgi:nuclear pore complex protein Nup107